MRVYIKVYESFGKKIVALCDEELLGKTLEENGIKITISKFYEGDLKKVEEINTNVFEDVLSINAVGEKSVNLLKKLNLIDDERKIKYVQGIPIAIVFLI